MRLCVTKCRFADRVDLVVLDKYHWMLYFMVTAMYPRFMITLDEKLENLPVTVRVGQVRLGPNLFGFWLAHLILFVSGPRRRRSGRQAAHHLRIPNAPNTSSTRNNGARGACDGGVDPVRARARGLCATVKEPWMGEGGQDGSIGHRCVW